jgi:hypothetical protein
LTEERKDKDKAIQQILLLNHPCFRDFAKLLGVEYRVSFVTLAELNRWLAVRTYSPVKKEALDRGSAYEWVNSKAKKYLRITENIFDPLGNLKYYDPGQWKSSWVQLKDLPEDPPTPAAAPEPASPGQEKPKSS